MRRSSAALLAGISLVLGAAAARAQPATAGERAIAIASIEVAGESTQELKNGLARAISDGVARSGGRVVGLVTGPSQQELASCVTPSCLARVTGTLGVSELVRAHVSVSGDSYEIDLELLSPKADGGLAGRVQRTCGVCTVGELMELVTGAAADLASGEAARTTTVEIVCRANGSDVSAEVTIDDQPRGVAPFHGPLPAGRHTIVARLDGFATSTKEVEIVAGGGSQRIEISLAPAAALGVSSEERPFRAWKWVAAGGAVAAVATGVALLAMNGDGTCADEGAECPMVYDTKAVGILGLSLGLLSGGASAWMFVQDR